MEGWQGSWCLQDSQTINLISESMHWTKECEHILYNRLFGFFLIIYREPDLSPKLLQGPEPH